MEDTLTKRRVNRENRQKMRLLWRACFSVSVPADGWIMIICSETPVKLKCTDFCSAIVEFYNKKEKRLKYSIHPEWKHKETASLTVCTKKTV